MVTHAKARQANDMTVGEAEALDTLAKRLCVEARGNPISIHALLIGTSTRKRDLMMQLWGVKTLSDLAAAIATKEGGAHA